LGAGDPLPDVGDHLVRKPDQVEVVGDDRRIRQSGLHRGAVGRARVDRDDLHTRPPQLAACLDPAGDGSAGAGLVVGVQDQRGLGQGLVKVLG